MPQSSASRQRHGNRVKRKDSGQTVSAALEVTPSSQDLQNEINRLKNEIDRLQKDRRDSEKETSDGFTLTAELRWKLNQLEKEKLQFTSRYNEEVSQYEAQVARLRAQVERGEAQRQTLEFDVAVARRDAAVERRQSEVKMREMREHNLKSEGVISELHQTVCDLQKSLEITQKAREDDHLDLQMQLQERDHLLLNTNAEKSRLETLIQEQSETLHKMKEEMERIMRDREKEREKLRNTSAEVQNRTQRQEKLTSELQSALEKVKVLEQNFKSERAAHLETRFNSEDMQVRIRDLENTLELEKKNHYDAVSSLELLNQKFSEMEREYTRERGQSQNNKQKLTELEKKHTNMKTDLIGQLEQKRAESLKLSVKLQEKEGECTERHQQIKQVQQSYDSVLCEIVELLHEYQQQGAAQTHHTGDADKAQASVILDNLRRTLHNYNTQLQESLVVMQKLNHEMLVKDERITDLQKNIQECEAHSMCVNEEVKRLRVCTADAATDADRAQKDLRRLASQLQDEKTQHTHTQTQMKTLQQQHRSESQEKLSFMHMLYQRLVAGCVLVTPAHSMLGSFSWAELSAMVQEHVDTLTSDLTAANQKVSCLESLCERQSAALERLGDQLKQRGEMSRQQRQDLNTHHTLVTSQLQHKIQDLSKQLEEAEGRIRCLEQSQSEQEQEVSRLQELVGVCGREEACLLAACGVLVGCVRALRRQVFMLVWQKAVLQERVFEAEIVRADINTLLYALTDSGVKSQPKAAHRFRCYVIAVLAAGRLRMLGRSSSVLFRIALGYGRQPDVCVSDVKVREEEDRVMKTLNSSELLILIHTYMEGIHEELRGTDCAISAVQSRCRKLFERLLSDVDSQCCGPSGKGSLARQLGLGLQRLTSDQNTSHSYTNSKVLVASLQKHILEFTQRLHSAEVERRNLRMQLSRIKPKDTHMSQDPHTACVPLQRFESVCSELNSALEREQCAQRLLCDQSTKLQQLNVRIQQHTEEQLEKNKKFAHGVQSLSDTKRQLKKKDQCLRSLEKQFNLEKKHLQQTMRSAEDALNTAAKNKESLMIYMKSVEDYLKEMRDDIIVCRGMSLQDRMTLQKPLLLPNYSSIIRNPQTDACQSLVRCFLELFQLMVCKMSSQDQKAEVGTEGCV